MLDLTDVSGGLGEWAVVKMGSEVVENLGGGGWGRGPQVQALIFRILKIELMPIQHENREKVLFSFLLNWILDIVVLRKVKHWFSHSDTFF